MSIFITFEGGEGSGKSTQVKLLKEYLNGEKYDTLFTHEPGGTNLGQKIRSILLETPDVDIRAQVLGFCTARAQLVSQVIAPKRKEKHTIIISDRYHDSTIAYQVFGGGDKDNLDKIEIILAYATRGINPDLTIYLDINVKEGLKRTHGRIKSEDAPHEIPPEWQITYLENNRFEEKELQYHKTVRDGYEWLIERNRDRWWRISADQPIEDISQQIQEKVLTLITEKGIKPKDAQKKNTKKTKKKSDKAQLEL